MSNSESFIDEVTEEVRKDRLFGLMRRYGWIAVLLILLIVGGAAWNEWRKAGIAAEAQATGDAIMAALDENDSAARFATLNGLTAEGEAQRVLDLLTAAEAQASENPAAAAERLRAVANDTSLSRAYRDLALLKLALMNEGGLSADEKAATLAGLAAPGAPYRLLAEEQLALMDIEAGNIEAAVERLNAIIQDVEVTAGLRQRATQLIVVSGGTLDDL